jgi:hypothetical protein
VLRILQKAVQIFFDIHLMTASDLQIRYGVLKGREDELKDNEGVINEIVCILKSSEFDYECMMYHKGIYLPFLQIVPKSNITLLDSNSVSMTQLHLKSNSYIPPVLDHNSNSYIHFLTCAIRDYFDVLEATNELEFDSLRTTIEWLTNKTQLLNQNELTDHEESLNRTILTLKIIDTNRELKMVEFLYEESSVRDHRQFRTLDTYNEYLNLFKPIKEEINFNFQFLAYVGTCCKFGETIDLEFIMYDTFSKLSTHAPFTITINHNGVPIKDTDTDFIFSDIKNIKDLVLSVRVSINETPQTDRFQKEKSFLKTVRKKISTPSIQVPKPLLRIPTGHGFCFIHQFEKGRTQEHTIGISTLREEINGRDWANPSISSPVNLNERVVFGAVLGKPLMGTSVPSIDSNQIPEEHVNKYYITLNRAKFISGKINNHSVQVTCGVRRLDGSFVRNAIQKFTGKCTEFNSVVFPNTNDPVFNETFEIVLDKTEMQNSHLFITFKNIYEDVVCFGFAYMPLTQSKNVLVKDDGYELKVYKYDESLCVPKNYLLYPAGSTIFTPLHISSTLGVSKAINATKKLSLLQHSIYIKTRAFSGVMSQDLSLVNFVNWKRTDVDNRLPLKDIILNFQNSSEKEVLGNVRVLFHAFCDLFFEMGDGGTLFDIVLPVKEESVDGLMTFLMIIQNTDQQKLVEQLIDSCDFKSNLLMLSEMFILIVCGSVDNPSLFRKLTKCWGLYLKLTLSASKHSVKIVDKIVVAVEKFFRMDSGAEMLLNQTLALENIVQLLSHLKDFKYLKKILDAINHQIPRLRSLKIKTLAEITKLDVFSKTVLREYSLGCGFDFFRIETQGIKDIYSEKSMSSLIDLFYQIFLQLEQRSQPITENDKTGISVEMWNRVLYIVLKISSETPLYSSVNSNITLGI